MRAHACRRSSSRSTRRPHAARRADQAEGARPLLSFRRSCREGVCGSDAMNINGKNGLACLTNMRSLPQTVVLKPLPGLPVVRDLFVDMTGFFKQYHSIKPWLVNDDPPPGARAAADPGRARRAQRPVRVHPVRLLLVSACPSFWWNPDKYVGPGRPAAGLPLPGRQPRPGHRRAAGQPRGSVPPVPLPHDPELHRRLPEGPEPGTGDQPDPCKACQRCSSSRCSATSDAVSSRTQTASDPATDSISAGNRSISSSARLCTADVVK
jgi:hypothetical protein